MVSAVDNVDHEALREAQIEAPTDLYRNYLKSTEGRDIHNIAAVLHLVQFMLSQLHKIQDSVVKEKSKASEYWTKQSDQSAEAKEFAAQLKVIETGASFFSLLVPMVVNEKYFPKYAAGAQLAGETAQQFAQKRDRLLADLKALQGKVSDLGSTAIKVTTNMAVQKYEAESNERMQHSQMHQGDKDTAQNTMQGLTQSLQAVIDGLRNALNTLGNQNKDASGR